MNFCSVKARWLKLWLSRWFMTMMRFCWFFSLLGTIFAYGQTGTGKTFTMEGMTYKRVTERTLLNLLHWPKNHNNYYFIASMAQRELWKLLSMFKVPQLTVWSLQWILFVVYCCRCTNRSCLERCNTKLIWTHLYPYCQDTKPAVSCQIIVPWNIPGAHTFLISHNL